MYVYLCNTRALVSYKKKLKTQGSVFTSLHVISKGNIYIYVQLYHPKEPAACLFEIEIQNMCGSLVFSQVGNLSKFYKLMAQGAQCTHSSRVHIPIV